MMPRSVRAFPAMFRIALADMIAYRAEFLIWVLSANMPLIMLAVWHAASEDAPVGRFGQKEFTAYYVATVIIRLLAQVWVTWEVTTEIRNGSLNERLMRPVHPIAGYASDQLAAIPMRIFFMAPVAGVLVYAAGDRLVVNQPGLLGIFLLALVGAWLMNFAIGVMMGTLSFHLESSLSVFDFWIALSAVFSGYLVPLELFPPWLRAISEVLPFKYMLAFPVETLIGLKTPEQAVHELAVQWTYVVVLVTGMLLLWRHGLRRYVAFGG